MESRISNDIKLQAGSTATNFTDMGKAEDIHRCIGRCCARPSCDIAYLLNDKCFAVQCLDGVLCQTSAEPASPGANVKLAYMNRGASGQKEKGKCEAVVIIFWGGMAVWGVKIVPFSYVTGFLDLRT